MRTSSRTAVIAIALIVAASLGSLATHVLAATRSVNGKATTGNLIRTVGPGTTQNPPPFDDTQPHPLPDFTMDLKVPSGQQAVGLLSLIGSPPNLVCTRPPYSADDLRGASLTLMLDGATLTQVTPGVTPALWLTPSLGEGTHHFAATIQCPAGFGGEGFDSFYTGQFLLRLERIRL